MNFGVTRHGMLPDGTPTSSRDGLRWSETLTVKPTDEIEIIYPTNDELPGNTLELYAANDASVAFVGEDTFVPTNHDACEHNERHYALSTVASGDYLLVHRRKNGTGDPLNCIDLDCPWTTFRGDQAVTLTLSIR